MYKSVVTELTAQNATETNKTLISTQTVPQGVKAIVGVGSQITSAGTTDKESLAHIIELESDDMAPWGGTQQFIGIGVATGLAAASNLFLNPYIHPCHIPVGAGAHIKVSTTFNSALTINPSMRCQIIYE